MYKRTFKGINDDEWSEGVTVTVSSEKDENEDTQKNPVRSIFPWVIGGTALIFAVMLLKK